MLKCTPLAFLRAGLLNIFLSDNLLAGTESLNHDGDYLKHEGLLLVARTAAAFFSSGCKGFEFLASLFRSFPV